MAKQQAIISAVRGRRTRFCNEDCRDGFCEDLARGLTYPQYRFDGQFLMGVEEASLEVGFCAFCGQVLGYSAVDYTAVSKDGTRIASCCRQMMPEDELVHHTLHGCRVARRRKALQAWRWAAGQPVSVGLLAFSAGCLVGGGWYGIVPAFFTGAVVWPFWMWQGTRPTLVRIR